MIDSTTHAPITVSAEDENYPYIVVPVDQLDLVKSIFKDTGIVFWEDPISLSYRGEPPVIFVNFGRGVTAAQVQKVLDAVKWEDKGPGAGRGASD